MARIRTAPEPSIGNWYLDRLSEEEFEVVGVDEENDGVEIQYFDGTISELNRDDWNSRFLIPIEAPEDWTGPLEPMEEGDVNYDQESYELPPKHRPLAGYEQDEWLQSEEANPHQEIPGSEAEE